MSNESAQSNEKPVTIAGKKLIKLRNGKEIAVYDRKTVKKDKPVVVYQGAVHKSQVTPEQLSSALKMKFSLSGYSIKDSDGNVIIPASFFKNDLSYWHFFINEAGEVLKKRIGNFSINTKQSFSTTNPAEFKQFSENYKKMKHVKKAEQKELKLKELKKLQKRVTDLELLTQKQHKYLMEVERIFKRYGMNLQ